MLSKGLCGLTCHHFTSLSSPWRLQSQMEVIFVEMFLLVDLIINTDFSTHMLVPIWYLTWLKEPMMLLYWLSCKALLLKLYLVVWNWICCEWWCDLLQSVYFFCWSGGKIYDGLFSETRKKLIELKVHLMVATVKLWKWWHQLNH